MKYVNYHLYVIFPFLLVLLDWIETFTWNAQRSVTPLVKPHNFMHPDDHLVLEDESGRVKLSGAVKPSIYVTGLYHRMKLNGTWCPFLSHWSLEELHNTVISFSTMLIHVAPVHPLISLIILYELIHVAFVVAAIGIACLPILCMQTIAQAALIICLKAYSAVWNIKSLSMLKEGAPISPWTILVLYELFQDALIIAGSLPPVSLYFACRLWLQAQRVIYLKAHCCMKKIVFFIGSTSIYRLICLPGNVVALHGKETCLGDFLVLDILEAGLPPQIERPLILSRMWQPPLVFLFTVSTF